jgi:hypothetical protein
MKRKRVLGSRMCMGIFSVGIPRGNHPPLYNSTLFVFPLTTIQKGKKYHGSPRAEHFPR